mgnify:CR=1 FL=1
MTFLIILFLYIFGFLGTHLNMNLKFHNNDMIRKRLTITRVLLSELQDLYPTETPSYISSLLYTLSQAPLAPECRVGGSVTAPPSQFLIIWRSRLACSSPPTL